MTKKRGTRRKHADPQTLSSIKARYLVIDALRQFEKHPQESNEEIIARLIRITKTLKKKMKQKINNKENEENGDKNGRL
ncbi:MAG TPA: hypothetical protein VMV86_06565 [Methanosarcinales archaeon]|nr:hypothetical protein [Methanosarcinales archaeon]